MHDADSGIACPGTGRAHDPEQQPLGVHLLGHGAVELRTELQHDQLRLDRQHGLLGVRPDHHPEPAARIVQLDGQLVHVEVRGLHRRRRKADPDAVHLDGVHALHHHAAFQRVGQPQSILVVLLQRERESPIDGGGGRQRLLELFVPRVHVRLRQRGHPDHQRREQHLVVLRRVRQRGGLCQLPDPGVVQLLPGADHRLQRRRLHAVGHVRRRGRRRLRRHRLWRRRLRRHRQRRVPGCDRVLQRRGRRLRRNGGRERRRRLDLVPGRGQRRLRQPQRVDHRV